MKIFLTALSIAVFSPFCLFAQNYQSIVNNVELSVVNNVNKVLVKGVWGEALVERIQLGYAPGTNNVYQLKISDAGINAETIGSNAILSKSNSYIFSAEQSTLISSMDIIDTVSEENGKPVFQVIVGIYAGKPITAKLGALDKEFIEIIVEERKIPQDANSEGNNQFSNTTNNLAPKGQVTFNEDGTPYIIPEEVGGSPRRGLTNTNQPRERVPVTSSLSSAEFAGAEQGGATEGRQPREAAGSTQIGGSTAGGAQRAPDTSISTVIATRNSNIYVDESASGPFGRVLRENPAFLNLMVLAPENRKNEAIKLSIILNKEKREEIQNKLGMSFRVVNVATLNTPQLKQTTIFYRQRYLKPASIIADSIDGDQRILKMVNPELKEGVDIEVIMGK